MFRKSCGENGFFEKWVLEIVCCLLLKLFFLWFLRVVIGVNRCLIVVISRVLVILLWKMRMKGLFW